MSANDEATAPNELVIIRRRHGGEDDGHHGGAWKIAYADFMTAMMAFFLVMWLISISDKKTITEIAQYFNPVKLSDRTTAPKSVHDLEDAAGTPTKEIEKEKKKEKEKPRDKPKDLKPDPEGTKDGTGPAHSGPQGKTKHEGQGSATKPDPAGQPADGKAIYSDEELFSDPYGTLAKLASKAAEKSGGGVMRPSDTEGIAARPAGQAFRDPFDPKSWKDADPLPAPTPSRPRRSTAEEKKAEAAKSAEADKQPEPVQPKAAEQPKPAPPLPAGVAPTTASESAKIETEIRKAFAQTQPGTLPNIEVQATSEGVLLSLSDEFDFGMFAVSSAEPRPELVKVMDKIAKIVGTHVGTIVVRGHTDGRPFKSGTYDNWRLSAARAHMAYHMLVRGGVDAGRFERIEGYGERSLKVPSDPLAARNRRIEILVRKGAT